MKVASSSIQAANNKVEEAMSQESSTTAGNKKRGPYKKYTATEKAKIGNYALQNGTTAALRHFRKDYRDLKWTTVNDWKVAIERKMKEEKLKGTVMQLEGKKRGRPSLVDEAITNELKHYILALREAGGVVNTRIVIAAGAGILQQRDPSAFCNTILTKNWAKYFLNKIGFVKRKATTKFKHDIEHFEERKEQFLIDIKAVVIIEEIPDSLIINWDQTGINYIPVSQWTMAKEGSKRVEIVGLNDKRQITAVFGGTLCGKFLPIQLVYQGKTSRCIPSIDFPKSWHITYTPNHWCNENTVLCYIEKIIVPYVQSTRAGLGLPPSHPALVIFDEFNGQTTDKVFSILEENSIFYVIVPPNCTDRLQPLDISVNKAAKEFLRSRFQEWYASKIAFQLKQSARVTEPVDLRLSLMKPIGAKWLIELYDYFKS